ncbi:hypothetical protein L210DRAFT_3612177 [Boletus edulis BED1]|uniref:C2H2-type domain-containing protein n=1 Tax=Boletus edulis BED1 TaxID=1328754 RepID=A0AAD4BV81_BOLED|nr:hypothetical protein L210DRAFT_3612177 [Boletus edulis BED1]
MPYRTNPQVLQIPCTQPGCKHFFRSLRGRTTHIRSAHPVLTPPPNPLSLPGSPERFSPLHFPSPSPPPSPSPSDEIDDDGWAKEDFDEASGLPQDPEPDPNMRFYGPRDEYYRHYHPQLSALPCDPHGNFLPPGAPPPAHVNNNDDWFPYKNQLQFETAEFLYSKCQMSATKINALLDLWASSLYPHGAEPPFQDHRHLHEVIDATIIGDVKWQSFSVSYTGEVPEVNPPDWMRQKYDVWFRDPRQVVHKILGNPSFASEMDLRPFAEYSTQDRTRQYKDFMSGEWAWEQADIIAEDRSTVGSTFVPIILGSDKTTVSVATGNNEYYPLYLSVGNVRNNVRHAHRDALVLIGFLAIPKTTNEHSADANFRAFRRQLFHSSLSAILQSLKQAMTTPEVVKYGDGYFRRTIYGLGPYIADYEEQVLLTCIVRGWCPRCRAPRENLDEDALDRSSIFNEALFEETNTDTMWVEYGIVGDLVLIKGCFKDHLVDWICAYISAHHSKKNANRILDEIDRRIAIIAPFTGLRRFPQGRRFKQWTGDDSKALMKVYIAAIEGFVPAEIVRTLRALLEFCYLVRRHIISEKVLQEIEDALAQFHKYRQVFMSGDNPVVTTFSLPRQHAAKHYSSLIRLWGAPNGLCSSITECKHIKAVKEPWRRSSKFNALGQMLRTNQRLDKIAAARVDFESRKMLNESCLSSAINMLARTITSESDNDQNNTGLDLPQQTASILGDNEHPVPDDAVGLLIQVKLSRTPQRRRAHTLPALAAELGVANLVTLTRRFLFDQYHPDDDRDPTEIPLSDCPYYEGRINVYNSACARFFAPSDLSGLGGMQKEFIRSTPLWRKEGGRRDCVFVTTKADDLEATTMVAFDIARVLAFFAFTCRDGRHFPCAIVRWFDKIGDSPDEDTGMWMVRPGYLPNRSPNYAVIHLDSIYRAAHLIPVYGTDRISRNIKPHHCYDAFRAFYVNKYVDHHAFEIAS